MKLLRTLSAAMVVLALSGCAFEKKVLYEVTGTASSVDITITPADGTLEDYYGVSLPWFYSFMARSGAPVSIIAQNMGSSGSVEVRIIIDGFPYKSNSRSGAYVVVSAYGTVP